MSQSFVGALSIKQLFLLVVTLNMLDLVYKFKKIIGNPNFSDLFNRIVKRFKRAGYTLDIMQQTAGLRLNDSFDVKL